jgi:hypothetical protein
MPELDDDDEEWEVEEVKDQWIKNGEAFYLIKWKGWPSEYNQWVPDEDMANAQGAIQKFHKAQGKKARPRGTPQQTNTESPPKHQQKRRRTRG